MRELFGGQNELYVIAFSLGVGFLVRFLMLRVDYRQYPSYPAGYATHLALGFVASSLGAVAFPALLARDYVAVTFLALAAQHFREVRDMERKSLKGMDKDELVPRGEPYIEGISRLFEARNYHAMITALITALAYHYLNLLAGIFLGLLVAGVFYRMMLTLTIDDIARVRVTEIKYLGPGGKNLAIEDEVLMNVGEEEALEIWKKRGMGFILEPRDDRGRATLAPMGQRQAILHEVSSQLGVVYDYGYQHFTPLARLDIFTGRVYIIILPIEPDPKCMVQAIGSVPVLEGSAREPEKSEAGKRAAD